jgi:Flp pilus assembly protein TadD
VGICSRPKLTWALALCAISVSAQSYNEHQAELSAVPIVIDRSPAHQAPAPTIPAELLRYPLSAKARYMLQKALQTSDAGDHAGAVKQLQKTLAKFPDSGAYVYSLLGVEFLTTDQIPEALDALEQAVKLLPHDASNHANLGLALLSSRQSDRAEPELRRALELDPHYAMASQLLNALGLNKNAQK